MKKVLLALFVMAVAASLGTAEGANEAAAAQSYPTKPVQLIVPWPAGGRTDINARMFASIAPKYLGQPVIVVNKAGGASVVGGDFVAKSKPDGYTLMAITPGTNIFPPLFNQAPYGPYDFDAIGQIGSSTMVMGSNVNRPWTNVQELVEYAKAHPGKVTYACVALKAPQLGFLRWADRAGVGFTFVPVGNDAEAIEAALGGHVDLYMTSSVATIISQVNAKKLNALLVFGEKRDPLLPNSPTTVELGYDVVASPFTGIAGPKGMPPEVLGKLREVFRQVLEDADFLALMKNIGESVDPKYGEEFLAVWKNDFEGNQEIIKKMGLGQQ